jgi:hypothetical protein
MRFLLFNIVVGAALLYLYKGGNVDLALFTGPPSPAERALAASDPSPQDPKPGHARDVITGPSDPAPAPVPVPAPSVEKPAGTKTDTKPRETGLPSAQSDDLPRIDETIRVAKRTPKKPVDMELPAIDDPAVRQRRAEVLGTSEEQPRRAAISLTEGSTLMSRSDRRRSLDALAEEMEMMFLDQTGG